MPDVIVKHAELESPRSRVWRALTDHREFGAWFGVNLEGPFAPGQVAQGKITYPGYEHVTMTVHVEKMEPERLFSFRWHPYAIDPNVDYSHEPMTLVEFELEKSGTSTLLTVTESGFDAIPKERRSEAFRMNVDGWEEQMQSIGQYVQESP